MGGSRIERTRGRRGAYREVWVTGFCMVLDRPAMLDLLELLEHVEPDRYPAIERVRRELMELVR